MTQLAIKGHPTRGDEVIEILEMLGGKKPIGYDGDLESCGYYINSDGFIDYKRLSDFNNYIIYSIEEFREKFPYEVGDEVYYDNKVCNVVEMLWNSNLNTISYGIHNGKIKNLAIVEELQPYKEETMEEKLEQIIVNIPDGYEFFGINDDNKIVLTKKKPQYPKTYEECCEILYPKENFQIVAQPIKGHNGKKLRILQKLLVCRDAYWKIAGEEMGLGKPWEPDWKNHDENKYCLYINGNSVNKGIFYSAIHILAFPTEEMRDTFYENFKDLIEECKEFL